MTPFETRVINAIDNLEKAMRIAPCEDTRECVEGAVHCLDVALKFVREDAKREAEGVEG